eukprot:55459-Amphidinium_carterae.2
MALSGVGVADDCIKKFEEMKSVFLSPIIQMVVVVNGPLIQSWQIGTFDCSVTVSLGRAWQRLIYSIVLLA